MSELKPCPFCGEQVFTPLVSSLDDGYTRCGLCGAKMQHRRWQTRPIEDELRKRIAELEEKQRWIPVSERLPEENVTVLVVTKRNRKPVVAWMRLGLWCSRGVDFALSVTHWMPLPQPPEVKQ